MRTLKTTKYAFPESFQLGKETHLQAKAYLPMCKCNTGFIYLVYEQLLPFNGLKDKQICKHIHTHFLENNFYKLGTCLV